MRALATSDTAQALETLRIVRSSNHPAIAKGPHLAAVAAAQVDGELGQRHARDMLARTLRTVLRWRVGKPLRLSHELRNATMPQLGRDENTFFVNSRRSYLRGWSRRESARRKMVRAAGVEPATFGFGGQRSIQLSYARVESRCANWCARQDSNLRPTGSKPGALSS